MAKIKAKRVCKRISLVGYGLTLPMFQTVYQGRGRLKAFVMCRKYYWRYFADYKVSLPFCPPHMTDGRVFRRPVIFLSRRRNLSQCGDKLLRLSAGNGVLRQQVFDVAEVV